MTVIPIRPARTLTQSGELIRAYRLYLGLSQRSMADWLTMARRSYQRIENGVDSCPATLLDEVEALADRFEYHVDLVLSEAAKTNGLRVEINLDPQFEWERNVAGRAAVVTAGGPGLPPIILAMSGN